MQLISLMAIVTATATAKTSALQVLGKGASGSLSAVACP